MFSYFAFYLYSLSGQCCFYEMCSFIYWVTDFHIWVPPNPYALEVGGLIYWNYLGVKMGNFRTEATKASPVV